MDDSAREARYLVAVIEMLESLPPEQTSQTSFFLERAKELVTTIALSNINKAFMMDSNDFIASTDDFTGLINDMLVIIRTELLKLDMHQAAQEMMNCLSAEGMKSTDALFGMLESVTEATSSKLNLDHTAIETQSVKTSNPKGKRTHKHAKKKTTPAPKFESDDAPEGIASGNQTQAPPLKSLDLSTHVREKSKNNPKPLADQIECLTKKESMGLNPLRVPPHLTQENFIRKREKNRVMPHNRLYLGSFRKEQKVKAVWWSPIDSQMSRLPVACPDDIHFSARVIVQKDLPVYGTTNERTAQLLALLKKIG
ncbi:hypothetical protein HDU84_008415 [Entophlyctis sp. JEL0112]|nr:hypothetical protein HDU84_008415 [Entophlyctis sp. JEL0112]